MSSISTPIYTHTTLESAKWYFCCAIRTVGVVSKIGAKSPAPAFDRATSKLTSNQNLGPARRAFELFGKQAFADTFAAQ
jgi:hypothetical protein